MKFSSLDINIVEDNNNDLIAISAIISTFLEKKILVDDGNVVEVLIFNEIWENGIGWEPFETSKANIWLCKLANQSEGSNNFPCHTRSRGKYND